MRGTSLCSIWSLHRWYPGTELIFQIMLPFCVFIGLHISPLWWPEPFRKSQLRHRWSPTLQWSPIKERHQINWRSPIKKRHQINKRSPIKERQEINWRSPIKEGHQINWTEILFLDSNQTNLTLCVSCSLIARAREQNYHVFNCGGHLVIKTFIYDMLMKNFQHAGIFKSRWEW